MTAPLRLGFNVPNLTQPATALSTGAAPAGSLRLALVFPAAGGAQLIDALGNVTSIAGASSGAALLAATQTFTGVNTFAPTAATSGSARTFTITGAANTGQTAATEATDIYLNLGRTVTFATGDIADQRAVRLIAPVYAFAGASTVGNAATLAIGGAPTAGANATLTNRYALWIETGTSRFDGAVGIGTEDASARLAVTSTTQGFLPPRMTGTQRDAIAAPAEGLIIYNLTTHKLNLRVAAAWEVITSA